MDRGLYPRLSPSARAHEPGPRSEGPCSSCGAVKLSHDLRLRRWATGSNCGYASVPDTTLNSGMPYLASYLARLHRAIGTAIRICLRASHVSHEL